MSYILTATLDGETETVTLSSSSDFTASLDALPIIMDNAHEDKQGVWAKGEIVLTDPNGNVVNRMEAKR